MWWSRISMAWGMGWDLVALVVLYSCLFQAQLTCSDWAEKGDDEMEDARYLPQHQQKATQLQSPVGAPETLKSNLLRNLSILVGQEIPGNFTSAGDPVASSHRGFTLNLWNDWRIVNILLIEEIPGSPHGMVLKPCRSWDNSEAVSLVLQIWIYFWYFNGWILHDFSSPAAMVVDQLFPGTHVFDCNRQPSWPSQFLQMLAKHLGKTNPMMLEPSPFTFFFRCGGTACSFLEVVSRVWQGCSCTGVAGSVFFWGGGWVVVFGERLFLSFEHWPALNRRIEGSLGY